MPPDALALIRRAKAEAKTKAKATAAPDTVAAPLPPLALLHVPPLPPAVAAPTLPSNSVHYVPEFISADDENLLLQHILGPSNAHRWSPGNGRRTQNYGGNPSVPELTEELPSWLQQLTTALVHSGAWPVAPDAVSLPPNHVIINEYMDGRTGLTPHTDGPLYAARVAVLSLMSDVVLELHRPCDEAVRCEAPTRLARMLLRPRSLNVLDAEAYHLFHGIRATDADTVVGESAVAAYGEQAEGVVNSREAGVSAEGETIARRRRVSIVFVCKLPEL